MRQVFCTTLTVVFLTLTIIAQTTTGRLLGSVSGPDGLLPGATVTVTDNQTKRELTTVAGSDGSFQIEQLSFGVYTVRISQQGFKTFVATDVKIDANRDYTLRPSLEIGSVDVEVTVQAGADLTNSSNAELSNIVSPRQVLELPINGRNPLSLLNLQAGVNPTSNSINGQRSSSQNYTRDGINIQDNAIRTGAFVQDRPTVDDTGEFAVVTQNAGANFGGGGSAQILLVTPRGGSSFHGAGFIYNRNSAFAANDFGNNASGTPKPFLNRNQFGGKVSGPLPIPGFGEGTPMFFKDKGFFFGSYERLVLRQTAPLTRRVLLEPFRTGNFTYLDNDGISRTINVLTGAGLTGPIPASQGGVLMVDPTIQARFLSLTPSLGNGPTQTILNTGQAMTQSLIFNQNDNDLRNSFTTRFDVDINDRNNVHFVYKYNDNHDDRQLDPGGFDQVPFGTQGGPTDLYILSYNSVLGSSFTNEVRGAFGSSKPFFNQAENFPTDYLIRGLPLGLSDPNPSFQKQGRETRQWTFQDNASYTVGNHSFRFGLDFNSQAIDTQTNFNAVPIFNISTTANPLTPRLSSTLFPGGINTTDRGRADALRYLLGGIVGSGSVVANFVNPTLGPVVGAPVLERYRYETYGLYFQDQWRATPELTLNLGLRWDYFTPNSNPDQVFLEPDLQGAETLEQIRSVLTDPVGNYVLVGQNAGKSGRFFKPDLNNFGPVVSFAYSPKQGEGFWGSLFGRNGQTVLRGGFRLGYINDEYVSAARNAAVGNAGLNFSLLAGGAANVNARFDSLPAFPPPPFQEPPISFADGNRTSGNFFNTIFAMDPNLQMQQNMEYNFGIQREIGFNSVIEVRYVGGRSNSLVRGYDFNQLDVNASGFLQDFNNARQNCRLQGATLPNPSPVDPLLSCSDARFNPAITGSVPLPVFDMLPFGSFLNNAAIVPHIISGNAGDLITTYITNGLDIDGVGGGINFRPNPNAGPIDLLTNGGKYRYNALQAEIRRRFTGGFSFQANYTFQKILADVASDGSSRFDPYLDLARPDIESQRADYDRTHTINVNAIYELPFGKGKRFMQNGFFSSIFGGIQVSSIFNISSGPPLSIKDVNGTFNRAARSSRQTAVTSLTTDQINDLIGIFKVDGRIYFINPSVIGPNGSATNGNVTGSTAPGFAGQVFFRNQPGQTSSLGRGFINGPLYLNWDAGVIKNIAFNERMRLQLRAEAFNVLNRTNFLISDNSAVFDINSTTFGQIQPSSNRGPRILQFAMRFEF